MATKLARMMTYLERLIAIKSFSALRNENHYISPTRVPMATKHGRMITYIDRLLLIKSLDSLITWSFEIT